MNQTALSDHFYQRHWYGTDSRPGYPVYYDRGSYTRTGGAPVTPYPPPERYQMIPGDYRDIGYVGDYPAFIPELLRNPPQSKVRPTPVSPGASTPAPTSAAITRNLTEADLREISESWQKSGFEYTSTIVGGGPNVQGDTIVTPDPQAAFKWRVKQQTEIIPAKKNSTRQNFMSPGGQVQPPARSYSVVPPYQLRYRPDPTFGDYYGREPAQVPYVTYPYPRY